MLLHSLLLIASLAPRPAAAQVEISTESAIIDNIRFSNLSKRVRDIENNENAYISVSDTNTWTGGNTFTLPVSLSSITWSAQMSSETAVLLPNGVTGADATVMGVCRATVTLTLDGWTELWFTGSFGSGASGQSVLGVLRDGAFFGGQGTTTGFAQGSGTDGGGSWLYRFWDSGSHSFCVTGAVSSGYLNIPMNTGTFSTVPRFGVRRIP
jgi:hypothetical protein